jgi:hypothetical protein
MLDKSAADGDGGKPSPGEGSRVAPRRRTVPALFPNHFGSDSIISGRAKQSIVSPPNVRCSTVPTCRTHQIKLAYWFNPPTFSLAACQAYLHLG